MDSQRKRGKIGRSPYFLEAFPCRKPFTLYPLFYPVAISLCPHTDRKRRHCCQKPGPHALSQAKKFTIYDYRFPYPFCLGYFSLCGSILSRPGSFGMDAHTAKNLGCGSAKTGLLRMAFHRHYRTSLICQPFLGSMVAKRAIAKKRAWKALLVAQHCRGNAFSCLLHRDSGCGKCF